MKKEITDNLKYLIQFQHPYKVLGLMPGATEAINAQLFDLDLETYNSVRKEIDERARSAASELAGEPGFREKVEKISFKPGQVIVGFGDSITDDSQSWIEIIRHLLEIVRPQDQLKVVNAGISGNTTTEMISRFLGIVQMQPDWLITMAGTNDCRRHGKSPSKILVSAQETELNLKMLRNYASTQTRARRLWLTPPTVIENMIGKHWFLGPMQMMWLNEDIGKIAEIVRNQNDPFVDINKLFGLPAPPDLLLDDGLHPSLAGQKLIARTVIGKLAEMA